MRAKQGSPKAITATAHKIARTVYHMLKYRTQYIDPGQDYYEQKYRDRVVKNLQRKGNELGKKLVPSEA
jgi:transposase